MRDEFLDPQVGSDAEEVVEAGLRPRALAEFVGQRELKEHLSIVLEAARNRRQPVDHLLFAGPPGLGKTTLAGIVATEMGSHLHVTSGPALERAGDLAAILTKLEEGDVLFVDEIHRLARAVEEILYPAMEDFQIDIVVGKGPAASSIRLTLPPFTLVGATTRTGMITGPLRDRFGLVARLDYYEDGELQQIVTRAAGILGVLDRTQDSQFALDLRPESLAADGLVPFVPLGVAEDHVHVVKQVHRSRVGAVDQRGGTESLSLLVVRGTLGRVHDVVRQGLGVRVLVQLVEIAHHQLNRGRVNSGTQDGGGPLRSQGVSDGRGHTCTRGCVRREHTVAVTRYRQVNGRMG